jgi:hypothetical protein
MSLGSKLAAYVLCLESCLERTHRAEDRSIYVKYLAEAGGLLAACVAGAPMPELVSRVSSHERLWGYTWLQDPVYREAAAAFAEAKEELRRCAS